MSGVEIGGATGGELDSGGGGLAKELVGGLGDGSGGLDRGGGLDDDGGGGAAGEIVGGLNEGGGGLGRAVGGIDGDGGGLDEGFNAAGGD